MMTKLNISFSFAFFGILIVFTGISTSALQAANLQESPVDSIKKTIFDALYSEQIRKIRLETDLQGILNNRKNEESVNGKFYYWDETGQKIKRSVKIQVRGKTRRRVCDFPPLRLKFKKKQLKKANLSRRNNLKLVTHCLDGKSGDQNVLKEYLIYKMYNQINEVSFRVQLLLIEYVDTQDTTQRFEKLGFIIENDEVLARQKSCKVVEGQFNTSIDSLQRIDYLRVALFQYMIGNTDWYISMLHNIKLLRSSITQKMIVVPYDFDYSGFVNTKYAKPNPNLGQTDIRDRIYMGISDNIEELEESLGIFRELKSHFFEQIDKEFLLHKKEKKKCRKYLEEFYETIESPKKVRKTFLQ